MNTITNKEISDLLPVLENISESFSDYIIVGGVALRILLLNKKFTTPNMIGNDVDIVLPNDEFNRIKGHFDSRRPNNKYLVTYKRRGANEIGQDGKKVDFDHTPNEYMALLDKENKYHIDIYKRNDVCKHKLYEEIPFKNLVITVATPEEICKTWILQITRDAKVGAVQKKKITYFNLVLRLINEATMDKVWYNVLQYPSDWKTLRDRVLHSDIRTKNNVHQVNDGIIPGVDDVL